MTKTIRYGGKEYKFPDDATDDEISEALDGVEVSAPDAAPAAEKLPQKDYFGADAAPVVERAPERSLVEQAGHVAGVVNRAALPYAVAGGVGAAAGPVGSAGAMGGMLLSELGTPVYNMFRPKDWPEAVSAAETIRRGGDFVGISQKPENAGERVLSAGVDAVAGGKVGGNAAQWLLGRMRPVATGAAPNAARTLMTAAADTSPAAMAAGGGSGVGGQVAAEMGGGPWGTLVGSLLGGFGAGAPVAAVTKPRVKPPVAPTTKDLARTEQDLYDSVEDLGITFENPKGVTRYPLDSRMKVTPEQAEAMDLPTIEAQYGFWAKSAEDALDAANTLRKAAGAAGMSKEQTKATAKALAVAEKEQQAALDQLDALDGALRQKHPKIKAAMKVADASEAKNLEWDAKLTEATGLLEEAQDALNTARTNRGTAFGKDFAGERELQEAVKKAGAKVQTTLRWVQKAEQRSLADEAARTAAIQKHTPKPKIPGKPDNFSAPDTSPEFFKGMVEDVRGLAESRGALKNTHPTTLDIINNDLGKIPNKTLTWGQLRDSVKAARAKLSAPGVTGQDAELGHRVLDRVEQWYKDPANAATGSTPKALALSEAAQEAGSRLRSVKDIEEIIATAKLASAGQQGEIGNLANRLRQGFRRLAENERDMKFFSAEEQELIRAAARGGPRGGRILEFIGGMSPGTSMRGLLSGAALLFGGGATGTLPAAAATAAVGAGARVAANNMAVKRAQSLADTMARGDARANRFAPKPAARVAPRVALSTGNQMTKEREKAKR